MTEQKPATSRQETAHSTFVELVDHATGLLQFDRCFKTPFELIATESGRPEDEVRRYYEAARMDPGFSVPEDICTATRAVLSIIVPETAKRVNREMDIELREERESIATLEHGLETALDDLDDIDTMTRGKGRSKKKQLPIYSPKPGYVGHFALKALVDKLIEEKVFRSAEDVDEALSAKGYCHRNLALDAYNKGRECTHRTYESVARLVLEHCNNGEPVRDVTIKFLKYVGPYAPEDTYTIGQLVRLLECVAVVINKLPHNKIEVVRIDGERRTYLENQSPVDVYEFRKPRGAVSGH